VSIEHRDLVVERLPAARKDPQGELGGVGGDGRMAAMEAGRHGDDLLRVHAAQALTQFGGCRVDDRVELIGGLGAGLDRAAPGDAQQPDRLHRAGL
jgi:hypothetical protein